MEKSLLYPRQRASVLSAGSSLDGEIHTGYGAYNTTAIASSKRPVSLLAPRTKRTWDGVFLPVSLSVFGVVLFIRLPWIVGQLGLWLTLLSIVLCYAVTGLTTISLAAISTNGFTGDGGPYLMVSRSLGPQIGLNVGIVFVISNIIASAMYLGGGADVIVTQLNIDALLTAYESHHYLILVGISSLMLLLLLLVAFLKIEKWFRLLSLVLTAVAIIDVWVFVATNHEPNTSGGFTGFTMDTLKANWSPSISSTNTYPKVLSILFPGVTGLMSGVCLSGELRNGAKAIPRGIGYAWVLSLLTYLVMAVVIAGVFTREKLQQRFRTLQYASHVYVFLPGEVCSAFAAVLAGLVGSSRVMKAMAKDDLIPNRIIRAISRLSNFQAVLVVYVVVQLLLLFGNQYEIASMFASQGFLANFLALNLSTFLTSATSLPSFRPMYSFFNEVTALCGAVLCGIVMFVLSPVWASVIIALIVTMLLLFDTYIDGSRVSWGDASQPLVFYLVRKWLLRLDERKEHIKHWRPSVLHLVTDPLCSLNLVHLANNLKKGGLYELAVVVQGDFENTAEACFKWKGWLMDFIASSGIKAFAVTTFGSDIRIGVQYLIRSAGLGGMHPNTVLLSLDELLMKDAFDDFYSHYRGEGFSYGMVASSTTVPTGKASIVSTGRNDTVVSNAFNAKLPQPFYNASGNLFPSESSREGTKVYGAHTLQMPSVKTGNVSPPLRRTAEMLPNQRHPHRIEETHSKAIKLSEPSTPISAGEGGSPPFAGGTCVFRGRLGGADTQNERGDAPPASSPAENVVPMKEAAALPKARRFYGATSKRPTSTPVVPSTFAEVADIVDVDSDTESDTPDETPSSEKEMDSGLKFDETQGHSGEAHKPGAPIMIHSYRSYRNKKAWRNMFMSNRNANEEKELKQIERMVEQRCKAKHLGTPDLAPFRNLKDFVDIVRDINMLNLTVLIARGMDKLDKQTIKTSRLPLFIDLWNPREDDPILFLLAHTLHLTSVWRKYTFLRMISVVSYTVEEDDEAAKLRAICKEHRIKVKEIVVLSLESQLPNYFPRVLTEVKRIGLNVPVSLSDDPDSQLDWIEYLMEQKHGRAMVMNFLMRFADMGNGCVGTTQTALSMIRVDVPRRKKRGAHSVPPASAPPPTNDEGQQNLDDFLKYRRSIRRSARATVSPRCNAGPQREVELERTVQPNLWQASSRAEPAISPTDDEGESWLDDLCRLSEELPPVLMVQGGSVKCRSSEW